MIDHVKLNVSSYPASREFYEKVLAPIGYKLAVDFDNMGGGLVAEGIPDLWLEEHDPISSPVHVAFSGPDRESVDEFYRLAMELGARDNGPPGLRPDYHQNYYAAFVLDPDGNNIEVVCHKPVKE